jgi:ParB family chromosome partitioning protein
LPKRFLPVAKRRLGKGIDALLQGRDLSQLEEQVAGVVSVPLDKLTPNPNQPRKEFSPEQLEELARSISERGIIQPILAEEQNDGTYVIVAGERRYRAAQMAGLTVVPVLPGTFSEEEKLEIALIENIQREDLNPMEEARAYRRLMDTAGLSQEDLSQRLGISRSAVANTVRLLNLPERVQEAIYHRNLSAGHARTLLALKEGSAQEKLLEAIEEEGLSVRGGAGAGRSSRLRR